MNIIIPMAGAGTRLKEYSPLPKPLIDLNGKTMIERVVENIGIDGRYIFIVQEEHYDKYNLQSLLDKIKPGCFIVKSNGLTEGGACSTLLAKHLINSSPLLIANSDALLEWNPLEFLKVEPYDGIVVTFECSNPRYGYVKQNGFITEMAEKKVISNQAMAGVHYWSNGLDYIKYAERMIHSNKRTNGEFYVCMVNEEALGEKRFVTHHIPKVWDLGTPEAIELYLNRIEV